MPITNFSTNKFYIWAVLGDFEIEIARIETNTALDSVPRAMLYCSIGREVITGDFANIHLIADSIKTNIPIIVNAVALELSNSGISGGAWPVTPFVI